MIFESANNEHDNTFVILEREYIAFGGRKTLFQVNRGQTVNHMNIL